MTGTYFNEIDRVACAVLRACHVGVVDERSIKEVLPDDVRGYERAHFFAGAGLWEIAADLARWRRPLWTASCPCQPFSVAGKGAGRDDPRHLWPDFFRLARAVRPPIIVGEQVAGSAGFDWFDGVAFDLEGEGYACRAVDIPACAVDAPHRRQRLYWVAVADAYGRDASAERQQLRREQRLDPPDGSHSGAARDAQRAEVAMADSDEPRGGSGATTTGREARAVAGSAWDARSLSVADADCGGRGGWPEGALGGAQRRNAAERTDGELVNATSKRWGEGRPEHEFRSGRDAVAGADGSGVALGDAFGPRLEGQRGHGNDIDERGRFGTEPARPTAAPNGSFWTGAEWLQCADGKARRAPNPESYFRDVADGFPAEIIGNDPARLLVPSFKGRAEAWRLAGNAIVPQVAAQVLLALQETLDAPM